MVAANGNGPVKLTVRQWANELRMNHMTLFRALRKMREVGDARGRFTTKQIRESLWTPQGEQKAELDQAKVEALQAKNAETRAGLIPAGDVIAHNQTVFGAIRAEINSWKELDAREKSNLLRHLPL